VGYIITSSFFSGVARTWTLVDARLLCYNRYALSSPFCPPFHRPSLMNFVMSFFFLHLVSNKHHTTNHHPICPCTPTHAYHSCCLSHVLSLLLLSLLRRPLHHLAWERYFLYNTSASPPHVFSKLSHASTFLPLPPLRWLTSIINKQKEPALSPLRLDPAEVDTDHESLYNPAPRAAVGRDHCTLLLSYFFSHSVDYNDDS